MTTIEPVDLKSMDIKKLQIENLKALFPETVTEGKIDFDKLKLTLGEEIETAKERYGMSWAGKSGCFRIIQEPSVGTLKPAREESVDFDTTENLFIEGENLEVLKLLQKSYYEKVKMIYIDPPYNTGSDLIYEDCFASDLDQYFLESNQKDKQGNRLTANTDSNGRFHSDWLNMIYARLKLSRPLLRDDGFIFISIGNDEVSNLKKV
jgi:adenine-specific DNA-methyltransferase